MTPARSLPAQVQTTFANQARNGPDGDTTGLEGVDVKRFLIFAVLFPPLAFVVGFWILLQILNWAEGDPTTFDIGQVVLLPVAHALAIVPALLTGAVDDALFKRSVRYRVLWTTLAGFVLIFLPALAAIPFGFVHGPHLYLFGIVGAVPAAICSWLAGMADKAGASA